jgi:putative cell wall-binding protein
VLGGQGAVSAAVEQELRSFTSGAVTRLSGPDRFQTAARIVDEFDPGQQIVLVATGSSFPDALAGGAAAGLTGSPIVLVQQESIPDASRAALQRLTPGRILVLGGTGAVSQGVFDAPLDTIVVATGGNFPDALAGTPAAALRGAPILLVTTTSIPDPIAAQLSRLNPREILVLGGVGAVNDQVLEQLRTYLRP